MMTMTMLITMIDPHPIPHHHLCYAAGPFSSDDGDDRYDETDKTIRGYSESLLIHPSIHVHMLHTSSVAMHASTCVVFSMVLSLKLWIHVVSMIYSVIIQ